MKIPQVNPWIARAECDAVVECLESGWITEGPKAKEFEEGLLNLIGAKYGVFAPNGTLALYLGMRAMGIGPGDEVIVPDFTFIASATSVEMTGAAPVLVDVNLRNFQLDLTNADELVTKKTKAIMPVHIYGTVADMDMVKKFAKKYRLMVIEDAAQAIGVHRYDRHAGTFGDVGCFSFFADKTITTGEGGFIVTDNENIYDKLLFLRNQGRISRGSFIHPRIGYNFRITDIQAAMGLVQLKKLDAIIKLKTSILNQYRKLLPEIDFLQPDVGAEWVPFRVAILHKKAHQLMRFMENHDISTRSFFFPLHLQPCLRHLHKKMLTNSIYAYDHGVCLPVFPNMTNEQIKYICKVIKEFK